ncbi:MAG: low specificity L-threonine aldolase [Bacteroidales bacterium]|jgi:threonine aldolase|nr:low specificity L-threonine aldolase [Bacteroidales bacterium]MDD2263406.1 low specificity L-threonine aldolase [Bacteroidales bacterium]MDD2830804.1 low specificity L-threonine aldolase [Bacteroidales bacterium]MDD3208003.1 low specificity L-threonine aldolase [Bacteroidales bacterium]MDD3696490.1 low specificity L-threonine aldolase [Bacteroidales bacterium]
MKTSFGSDNHSGVHPVVLKALADANKGYCLSYGEDDYTLRAQKAFKSFFGEQAQVFFVFNGTGANVLCLQALTRPYHVIICARTAHINQDECGAPERFTGCKVITVDTPDGKLRPSDIQPLLFGFGFQHHSQPKVISISQATELGTIYRPEEIRALADLAHRYGMYLHMDGSRLANAAASLNFSLASMTTGCGVDALSFGGTKNGMLMGEAVVLFHPDFANDFLYIRKQCMQLFSKSRFVAAQYLAYLENGLWLENARHANKMAKYLEAGIRDLPKVTITQKVESNAVFAIIPEPAYKRLLEKHFFYTWDESTGEVRWMCSFNTRKSHIDEFVNDLKTSLL